LNSVFSNINFIFSFPKNENRRRQWLSSIPVNLLKNKNFSSIKICSKHFTLESFIIYKHTLRNILNQDAIPTIFEEYQQQSVQLKVNFFI